MAKTGNGIFVFELTLELRSFGEFVSGEYITEVV